MTDHGRRARHLAARRDQKQLDAQGEVITAVATLLRRQGKADRETSRVLVRLGGYICDHWHEPDAGIWEGRDEPVVHTHSRLLCWTGLDALLRLAESGLLERVPVERFRSTADDIRRAIERDNWRPDVQAYTNEPGRTKPDAALLLMTRHGFTHPTCDRVRQTRQHLHDRGSADWSARDRRPSFCSSARFAAIRWREPCRYGRLSR